MKSILVTDPFLLNEGKMAYFHQVFEILSKHFPDHQLCASRLYCGQYTYFQGEPSIEKLGNSITDIWFGVLTPMPADTRKTFFGIPIGEAPEPLVMGGIRISFQDSSDFVSDFTVSVFGLENKSKFQAFLEDLEQISTHSTTGVLFLNVESEYPLKLHRPI